MWIKFLVHIHGVVMSKYFPLIKFKGRRVLLFCLYELLILTNGEGKELRFSRVYVYFRECDIRMTVQLTVSLHKVITPPAILIQEREEM